MAVPRKTPRLTIKTDIRAGADGGDGGVGGNGHSRI
jgi:hypothetical protein